MFTAGSMADRSATALLSAVARFLATCSWKTVCTSFYYVVFLVVTAALHSAAVVVIASVVVQHVHSMHYGHGVHLHHENDVSLVDVHRLLLEQCSSGFWGFEGFS